MVATISALVHHWDMIRGSDGRASMLDGGLSEFVLAKGTCCSQRTSPPTAGDSRFGSIASFRAHGDQVRSTLRSGHALCQLYPPTPEMRGALRHFRVVPMLQKDFERPSEQH